MKKLLFLSCAAFLVFQACKKKEPDAISKVVEVSYPTITVKGLKYVTVNVNAPYTDEGATLLDDVTGQQSTIYADTPIEIDYSIPGLYSMTYSAKNANGYGTTTARYIAVTNYPDTINLTGRYQRQAAAPNNRFVNLTRVSRAMYATSDMGGAGLPDVGYFAVLDTNEIDFGYQFSETIHGYIYGDNSFLRIWPGDTSYAYVLHAAGYGTAQRIFKKQ